MSYLVVVTFDIKDGEAGDYETVYKAFERVGLRRTLRADKGDTVTLPTTTTAGEVDGDNAGAVRDDICERTQDVFRSNKLHGKIFVAVGGNWAWGQRNP